MFIDSVLCAVGCLWLSVVMLLLMMSFVLCSVRVFIVMCFLKLFY